MGNTALQILRIRLNMFPTKSNFKANQESFACPKCSSQDDTTEHVVECYTGLKSKELRRFDTKNWQKILEGFKKYTEDAALP